MSFTYSSFETYSSDGGFTGSSNADGTLTDVGNDLRFEVGDDGGVLGLSPGGSLSYVGTYQEGGTVYPVFQSSNFGVYAVFSPDSNFGPSSFTPGAINAAPFVFCFAPGTRITTPDGDRPIETLGIGDPVLTADGRTVPVLWLGQQTLFPAFSPRSLVRITAGALGHGLPRRDLLVTGDHGMIVDGILVNASALVNDTTITWEATADLPASLIVYHVETEAHDVILAEGSATETFIDYAGRAAFDNHDEYLALYGAERIIPEMPLPRISSARMLPDLLKRKHGLDDVKTALSA